MGWTLPERMPAKLAVFVAVGAVFACEMTLEQVLPSDKGLFLPHVSHVRVDMSPPWLEIVSQRKTSAGSVLEDVVSPRRSNSHCTCRIVLCYTLATMLANPKVDFVAVPGGVESIAYRASPSVDRDPVHLRRSFLRPGTCAT